MKLIPLTQGKFAQVDDEDFEELNKYKWYAWKKGNTFYAARNTHTNKKWTMALMHRTILNIPPKMVCDHIDGNGLNNQKENLRITTRQQNVRNHIHANRDNKLGIKGVYFDERRKKFVAKIMFNGKKIFLGHFNVSGDADDIYRTAEKKYYGEFARKDQFLKRRAI